MRGDYVLICKEDKGLGVFGKFFKLCCFAHKIESRRRLLKTITIFLNFVLKTALI